MQPPRRSVRDAIEWGKPMDWEMWENGGFVCPAEGGREPALAVIGGAWQHVVNARASYLQHDFERTERYVRSAFLAATKALLLSSNLRPARRCDFEFALRAGRFAFGDLMISRAFERARALREALPLEGELTPEQDHMVRRGVAASSEYVALVESQIYM